MFSLRNVGKEVGREALTVLEKGGPLVAETAATAFGGPLAGNLVGAIVSGVTSHVTQTGTAPNVDMLKVSVGQLIEGIIGVLQATGKIPYGKGPETPGVVQVVVQAPPQAPVPPAIPGLKPPTAGIGQ